MSPLTVANYTIPGNQADVPSELRDQYRAGGFSERVRDWHLDRIPRLTIAAGTYIICPWCGKEKDFRSMQIDHIIPIQQFSRYKLWLYSKTHRGRTDLERRLRAFQRLLYSESANLLLCCMKCNSSARNTMPNSQGLKDAAERVKGSILETKLLGLIPTLQAIRDLRPVTEGRERIDLNAFVLKGADWYASRRNTRQSASPINRSTILGRLSMIHNVVVDLLVRGRPMWSITASSLLSFQPTRSFSNEEGRLCFYCLGLFKKQAFQIDHINPASQRAPNPAVYSNPTNLIPVCRTCNTAKGIKSLSTFWLDEQIAARQREGLPGVENAVGVTTPVPYPSYLDFVKAQRARVLGC